jgi:hypothetical protein
MNSLRKEMGFRAANIRHYFPDVLANAEEFIALDKVVDPELNLVIQKIFNSCMNTFVYDVDEDGLERYEKMLGIVPGADDRFESRRSTVLAKINNMVLYTHRSFQQMLDSQYGKDNVIASLDYDAYTLYLDTAYRLIWKANALRTYTRCIIPAHLDIKINNTKIVSSSVYAGGLCKTSAEIHITPNLGFKAPEIGQSVSAAGNIDTVNVIVRILGG